MVEIVRNVTVGELAADFTISDHNGVDFVLSTHKGKRVLLSFHPLAWTAVCAGQMLSLEKNYSVFESLNTMPVGLSVDPVPSKKAWAESLGIKKLPLLSDFWPHGDIARLFDIFREKNGVS